MSAQIYTFPKPIDRRKRTNGSLSTPLIEVSVRGDSIDVEITQDSERTIISLSSTAATDLCLILAESIEDVAADAIEGLVL